MPHSTTVWGPILWQILHGTAIRLGELRLNQSEGLGLEIRKTCVEFIRIFPKLLPCPTCRESSGPFVADIFERMNLTLDSSQSTVYLPMFQDWNLIFYKLHEQVNTKLHVENKLTYHQMICKYKVLYEPFPFEYVSTFLMIIALNPEPDYQIWIAENNFEIVRKFLQFVACAFDPRDQRSIDINKTISDLLVHRTLIQSAGTSPDKLWGIINSSPICHRIDSNTESLKQRFRCSLGLASSSSL